MKFYVLIVEEKVKAFSLVSCGDKYGFSMSTKGNSNPLEILTNEDKILGFLSGEKQSFCYTFNAIKNDDGIFIEKVLEVKDGVSLNQVSSSLREKINSSEQTQSLVEIDENQYYDIINKMISSLSNDKKANAFEQSKYAAKGGENRIYYGAPGCGKSRYVTNKLKKEVADDENIIRVTFHPEYANCDFIGQIMPIVEKKDDKTESVKYVFNPGPFTLALLRAYEKTSEMVYLIVEEINRGNAASIFGDMFQLLDRERDEKKSNYTASEYPVSNPNLQNYLIEHTDAQAIRDNLRKGVYIPSNLTIYATMNSSDQNVFTLDTAFKRRWNFKQISNDILHDSEHKYKTWYVPGTDVTWETFLTVLNNKILEYKIHSQTNEDKRLGKYFVTKECLTENIEDITNSNVQDIAMEFAYKVLEYIWNDVCKIGREEWFDTEKYKTLEELIDGFVNPKSGEKPLSIFQNIDF